VPNIAIITVFNIVVRFINEGNPMYEGTTTNLPQNTDNPLHGTKITYNVRAHPRVAFLRKQDEL
jgi:hypothetical protein